MKKILVCEDDKFLSGAYRIKFTKLGFDVQLASDGDDAFVHLQTFTPDLILLDLIMPGKDGFSTLVRLRSDERWKHIPVIVASNLGQKEDIDKSMALGANDFIIKSDTSLEQVVDKIYTLLQLPKTLQSIQNSQVSQSTQPSQAAQTPPTQQPPQQPPPPSQQAPQSQQVSPPAQNLPKPVEKEENVR